MQYYRHPIITPYFEMGFNFGHQTSRHGDSWPHLLVRGSRSPKVLKEPSVRISRPPKQWRNLKEVGASNHSEYLHTFITMYDIWYTYIMGYLSWAPIDLVTNCRSNGILISMGSLHHMGWFSKYSHGMIFQVQSYGICPYLYGYRFKIVHTPIIGRSIIVWSPGSLILIHTHTLFDMYSTLL